MVLIFCSNEKITAPVERVAKIAYMSGIENIDGSWDIHVISADGSNHINITADDTISYGFP